MMLDTFTMFPRLVAMAASLLAMSSEMFPTVAYVIWIYREMVVFELKV